MEELERGLEELRDRVNYLSRKSLNHKVGEGDNPYRAELIEIKYAIKLIQREIKEENNN